MKQHAIEARRMRNMLPDDLLDETEDFFVAGGAVSCVFTGREVNDVDIYPKTSRAAAYILHFILDKTRVISVTERSVFSLYFAGEDTYALNLVVLQDAVFPTAEDIFNKFDFTVVMGAYDVAADTFVLHDRFMLDNAARRLHVHTGTQYPIESTLRVQKYASYGYKISRTQMFKLLLRVTQLNIRSYEELKNHLGGLYGYNILEVLGKHFGRPVSLNDTVDMGAVLEALDSAETLEPVDRGPTDYMKSLEKLKARVYGAYSAQIAEEGFPLYVRVNGMDILFGTLNTPHKTAMVNALLSALVVQRIDYVDPFLAAALPHAKESQPTESYLIMFKNVRRHSEGVWKSVFANTFKYKVEEAATSPHGLWFYAATDINRKYYSDDTVTIACLVYSTDIIKSHRSTKELVVSKAIPLCEVARADGGELVLPTNFYTYDNKN
jgi:hypothetical protein